jgi:hypothetical protein
VGKTVNIILRQARQLDQRDQVTGLAVFVFYLLVVSQLVDEIAFRPLFLEKLHQQSIYR